MKHLLAIAALVLAVGTKANATGKYDIDNSHSAVSFKVHHLGAGYVWGRFKTVSGTFNMDEKNPSANSVTVKIDPTSVETFDAKRDEHLRGPDFLNTKEFKEIIFVSKKVEKAGENYKITGDLTLNGKKNSITVEAKPTGSIAKDPWGFERYGFEAAFDISLADYKVKSTEGVGAKIYMIVGLEGTKKI